MGGGAYKELATPGFLFQCCFSQGSKATSRTNLTDDVVDAAFSDMLRHKMLLTAFVEDTAFLFAPLRPIRRAEDIMVTWVKDRAK